MTAFPVDEMFPMATAVILRDTYGYDALHVAEVGLRGADDAQVAAAALADGRVLVTENRHGLRRRARRVTSVFVLKKNLPVVADRPPDLPRSSTTGRRTTRNPLTAQLSATGER